MPPIVLATCSKKPELLTSDVVLAKALENHGAVVMAAPWNGAFKPFRDAQHIVIRSTWDYFDKLEKFYAWFDQLDAIPAHIHNSLDVLRWNAKKNYLFELIDMGAPVIPTVAVESSAERIVEVAKERGWQRAVLKCLVSGSALGLSLIDVDDTSSIELALTAAHPWSKHGLMLQPFLSQVTEAGELSLVFIAGNFAHAVQKLPAKGEFRVQSEYGGQYVRFEPHAALVAEAAQCLSFAPGMPAKPPLYARVDGIVVDDKFLLMELELTEPELMFPLAPESAELMATAILNT